jgi:hypothetical protein
MDEKRHAELRMLSIGALHRDRANSPVGWADTQTSMADARIASCLADGIPIEDIDPCGYDLTRRAYESSRRSWRTNWHTCGGTPSYRRGMQDAHDWWAAIRPEYIDGDDWFAGLTKPEETH